MGPKNKRIKCLPNPDTPKEPSSIMVDDEFAT